MTTDPPQPRLTRDNLTLMAANPWTVVSDLGLVKHLISEALALMDELADLQKIVKWQEEMDAISDTNYKRQVVQIGHLMDERDQLRDHVVAITIQREDLRDERSAAVEMFNQANREYGEVCVERDALRTALEQIRDMESDSYGTDDMHKIARAALSATSEASNAS